MANISGKINGGIYDRRIEEALRLDPLKTGVKFKSAVVKKADVVKVTSQWEEKDTGLGMKVTGQLVQLLSDNYGKIVEQRKGDYYKQILMKQSEISKIETQRKDIDKQIDVKLNSIEKTLNDIKLQQATLRNIRQRKGELLEEIKGVKDNTEKIVQQRNFLLKDKNPGKALSPPLFYNNSAERGLLQPVEQSDL